MHSTFACCWLYLCVSNRLTTSRVRRRTVNWCIGIFVRTLLKITYTTVYVFSARDGKDTGTTCVVSARVLRSLPTDEQRQNCLYLRFLTPTPCGNGNVTAFFWRCATRGASAATAPLAP